MCELFPVDGNRRAITGHSMGGHGALVAHLKNPGQLSNYEIKFEFDNRIPMFTLLLAGMFKSVSAFAPISNPTQCPWGDKAFKVI